MENLKIGEKITKVPLIQGGMGVGISLGRLAGSVAKAGGIGVISTAQIGYREPDFDKHPEEANLRAIGKEMQKAYRRNAPSRSPEGRTCRRSHIRGCVCPRAATLPRAPSPRGRGGCTRARSPTRTARRAAVLSSGGHRWRRWRRLWRRRSSCQNSMALHFSPICLIFSSVRGRA